MLVTTRAAGPRRTSVFSFASVTCAEATTGAGVVGAGCGAGCGTGGVATGAGAAGGDGAGAAGGATTGVATAVLAAAGLVGSAGE